MTTRFPAVGVTSGAFSATVDFDPKTGVPCAVFINARGGKIGQELDQQLYDLSTEISRVMKGKP